MSKVDLIAEIGLNHDGSFEKACRMVEAVAKSGVRIAKFQHYDALKLLGADSPYLEYASKCQFTKEEHERLANFCELVGVEYLVSVFDINDVLWADMLCKRHKVASRMNQDKLFIEELRSTGKEVIISTQLAYAKPMNNVRYMYCVTKYPTPEADLKDTPCGAGMGLSSHCPSIGPSIDAIAKGATLIEHHVCISRDEEGCDKPASITFEELAQLNRFANEIEVV